MGWWVAGGWVDKKRGVELGEWRRGRRGGVVEKGEEVAEGFLGNQNNRVGVGSNVPFKAVDTLQHFYITQH